MALFFLLKWAQSKDVNALNIFGDSYLVIHFIKGWAHIDSLSLAPLANQLKEIIQVFYHIK